MRHQLRKAWRAGLFGSRRLGAAIATVVDKEDVLTLLGLILLAAGLWRVSPAAALIVPAVILLWMFVPARPPFIERSRDRRPPT